MSIKPRGNSFMVDIRKKGHERVRRTFSTVEEAKLFEAQVGVHHRSGTPLPEKLQAKSEWTLAKAQDACFKMHWDGGKSEQAMLKLMQVHCRYFGANVPISAINTGVLDSYIEHMKLARKSNATINRHLACISKVLRLAHEQDKLDKFPHFLYDCGVLISLLMRVLCYSTRVCVSQSCFELLRVTSPSRGCTVVTVKVTAKPLSH